MTEARSVDRIRQPVGCAQYHLRLLVVALTSVAAGVAVTTAQAASPEEAELAELQKLAAELGLEIDEPVWQLGGDASAGIGYGDNVLRAAVDPVNSGFAQLNAGGMAIRDPRGPLAWYNTLDGTLTRYFSDEVDNGVFVLGRSELRWRANDTWRFIAAGQLVHQNEVMDASSLDLGAARLQVKVTSIAFEPAAQWNIAPGWSARAQGTATRDDFHQFDDYDELGGELTLTRDFDRRGAWTLATGITGRDYDSRPQATIGGGPIFDTVLGVTQERLELRYSVSGGGGDGHLRWRARLKFGLLDNDDNGEGWYDYRRQIAQASLAFEQNRWRIDTSAGWRRYLYRVQYAGFGIDPPKLWRGEWNTLVRVERELRDGLNAFLEMEYEHGGSNDEFLRFHSTTVVLGLQLSH